MTMAIVSKEDVKFFCYNCVYMRSIYEHARVFFEFKEFIQKTAPIFFGDIHRLLNEAIVLQICKITDPAKDSRGNVNITIEFFVNNFDFSAANETVRNLKVLSDKMHEFRNKIKPARDKIISHSDRDAILNGKPLGGVCANEWNEFWLSLQEFVCILHEHYLGERIYVNAVGISDASSMINALRKYSI